MKAYINSKGVILAVFKTCDDDYAVYRRKDEFSDFVRAKTYYPPRATRAEAETDLTAVVYQTRDKSYKLIDFRG